MSRESSRWTAFARAAASQRRRERRTSQRIARTRWSAFKPSRRPTVTPCALIRRSARRRLRMRSTWQATCTARLRAPLRAACSRHWRIAARAHARSNTARARRSWRVMGECRIRWRHHRRHDRRIEARLLSRVDAAHGASASATALGRAPRAQACRRHACMATASSLPLASSASLSIKQTATTCRCHILMACWLLDAIHAAAPRSTSASI